MIVLIIKFLSSFFDIFHQIKYQYDKAKRITQRIIEVDIELDPIIGVKLRIAIISIDKVVNHSKNEIMYISKDIKNSKNY